METKVIDSDEAQQLGRPPERTAALGLARVAQALAPVQPLSFTAEQRKMIRDSFAKGASDSEFEMLMEVARLRNLNPLLKQIHFVKRPVWDPKTETTTDVWAYQVAIDGFRAIAERSGRYDGQDEPEWIYEGDKLVAARVRVYRTDRSRPFVGIAYFNEYVQTKGRGDQKKPNAMWEKMPRHMLAKVSEAMAMRKAFPEDLSGFYVPEEMRDLDEERAAAATDVTPRAPQLEQRAPVVEGPKIDVAAEKARAAELAAAAAEEHRKAARRARANRVWKEAEAAGITQEAFKALVTAALGGTFKSSADWSDEDLDDVAVALRFELKKTAPPDAHPAQAPETAPSPEGEPDIKY